MIKTSEYCALGHPDRTCDYIASYILDRYLERNPSARVGLEVQLKDAFCTVSGEVTTCCPFSKDEIAGFCREAVNEIGYTRDYRSRFGEGNCIVGDELDVTTHLSQQSGDIARGVNADGWGDQGIFWGMAEDAPERGNMPLDYWLARRIAQELASRKLGGLDVKTQVTVEDGRPVGCVVAIPLADGMSVGRIETTVREFIGADCELVVNGTGRYVKHGSIGDCGTTGRKLVVDFYGGNCRIGGGSPWGKDPTKADVTLNIYARKLALEYLKAHGMKCVYCSICCCIGRAEVRISFFDARNELLETRTECVSPSRIIDELGLRSPGFADRCAKGLFGYE